MKTGQTNPSPFSGLPSEGGFPVFSQRSGRRALLLALLIVVFSLADPVKALPQIRMSPESVSAFLVSTSGTNFQSLEATRETSGGGEEARVKEFRTHRPAEAGRLYLLSGLPLSGMAAPGCTPADAVPFPVCCNHIHSRQIILFFIERQDGLKRANLLFSI